MLKICSAVLILLFMSGCAQIRPFSQATYTSASEHVLEKNYTKNEKQTVYVGQSIVKVKDYYAIESSTPFLEATNDYEISGPFGVVMPGRGGIKIPIIGETTLNNKAYKVFQAMRGTFNGLIDNNGVFSNTMLSGIGTSEINPWTWKISPESTIFNVVSRTTIDTKSGFINYELLYGGTNGNSFSVTYREYTPDNLARPAFYQDLTFSNSSKHIRYKNLRIKIHNVNNEEITYTVVED